MKKKQFTIVPSGVVFNRGALLPVDNDNKDDLPFLKNLNFLSLISPSFKLRFE